MICFLFQPSRGGKRSRLWSARVRLDDWAVPRTFPLGVSDKRVAQQKLTALTRELEREAAGISVPRVQREGLQKPLSEHVGAFLADLKGKGRAHGTVKRYRTLLRVLFTRCGWQTFRDVDAVSFSTWRARSGLGAKHLNDMLGAASTLFTWMERRGIIAVSPLRHVEKVKNDQAGAFRRALSADEVARLLAAAPPSRAWVYLVILYTGLRRHELNRLTWGHFHLDASQPFVELPANITKNRKSDRLPLRVEVVDALRGQMPENSMPFEWVFRGKVPMPAKLRKDLAAAGIPVVDDRGRRVDVHALRTTFGTMLSVAGVTPRVAMELMRHSDLKLTMRIYTDAAQLPLAEDVQRLPSFSVSNAGALVRQGGGELPVYGTPVDAPVPLIHVASADALGNDAQIDAQISAQNAVTGCVRESQRVANGPELANTQAAEIVPFSPAESQPVTTGVGLKMVGAVRFELTTSTSRT